MFENTDQDTLFFPHETRSWRQYISGENKNKYVKNEDTFASYLVRVSWD